MIKILLISAIVWMIIFSMLFHYVISKALKYTKYYSQEIKKEWKPFQRSDRKQWKLIQMWICGYLFVIPRTFCMGFSILNVYLGFRLVGCVEKGNYNKEYPKWKRQAIKLITRTGAIFIQMGFGFTTGAKYKDIKIESIDKTYRRPSSKSNFDKNPPITISNHVSGCDPFVILASRFVPSFLAKKDVESYPIYGSANLALQSIYLDRDNESEKNLVLNAIKERGELIKQGKNLPPLHIFPEGTVSNGQFLISFKRGAFESKLPIGIMCLKYETKNFAPSFDIGALEGFLGMCQWRNEVTLYNLGTYYPEGNVEFKNDENDWKLYADKVKQIMIDFLKIEGSESGYRHAKEYCKYTMEINKNPAKFFDKKQV